MKVILLPKVYDELEERYYINNKHESFQGFMEDLFNPDNRGIIYTSEKRNELIINLWSKELALVCAKASEEGYLKAIRTKRVSNNLYNRILEKGLILNDDVEFIEHDVIRFNSTYSKDNEAKEWIEEVHSCEEKKEEYKKYEEYWYNQDKIRVLQEEAIINEQKSSLNEYTDFNIDFERKKIIFILKEKNEYRTGDRVSILCKNDFHAKSICDKSEVFNQGILCGEVELYDDNSKRMIINVLNENVIKILKDNKSLKQGFLWKDISGTKSILNKEKQALQKLFNCETANIKMKNFIPDIKNIEENQCNIELKAEDFTEKFSELTEAQKEAIRGAISQDDIYLIQGPPGTGKTTVISEIIQYAVNNNNTVLLSSQTNLAVDNAIQRIGDRNSVRAIRIGEEAKIEDYAKKYLLANRVKDLQKDILGKISRKNEEIEDRILNLNSLKNKYNVFNSLVDKLPSFIGNIIKKTKEEEKVTFYLEKKNKLIKEIGVFQEFIEYFETKVGQDVIYIDKVKSLYKASGLTKEEVIQNNSVHEEVEYNKYKDIVNEYGDIIKVLENYLNKKTNLDKEIGQVSLLIKNIEEDLTFQKNSFNFYDKLSIKTGTLSSRLKDESQKNKSKIVDLETNYNSLFSRLKQLKESLNDIDIKIKIESDRAYKLKGDIESIILSKNLLWKRIYSKDTITKKDLLALFQSLENFHKIFEDHVEHLYLINYLGEYDRYLACKVKYNELNEELNNNLVNLKGALENVQAYTFKINEVKDSKALNDYLALTNKDILQISEDDINSIKEFLKWYEQEENETDFYRSVKDIRDEWLNRLDIYQESLEEIYINTSNLIGATCLGIASTNNNAFLNREFDYVIIDEAARASSLELLIPMAKGRKIILVGDHKQLSPSIEKAITEKLKTENIVSEDELKKVYGKSLFGIMYEDGDESIKTLLDTQFRMHNDIAKFVSNNFYNGSLKNGANIRSKKHNLRLEFKNSFYWVDTPIEAEFKEQQKGKSYYNSGEANLINDILYWLDTKLTVRKSVGIITPYITQVNVLKEMLEGKKFKNIDLEINTVDAFQGREKNFIIMSLVRNNDKGSIGFINYSSRINVAISRAQELLMIVGNRTFINENKAKAKTIANVIDYLESKDCIIDNNFFKR